MNHDGICKMEHYGLQKVPVSVCCEGNQISIGVVKRNILCFYRTGFEGVNCQIPIDECAYDPPICLNNGICQNDNNTFTCYCGSSASGNYFTGTVPKMMFSKRFTGIR